MKSRKLLDGTTVKELEEEVTDLLIRTLCPNQYKLVDMETGEEYIGCLPEDTKYHWKKIETTDIDLCDKELSNWKDGMSK